MDVPRTLRSSSREQADDGGFTDEDTEMDRVAESSDESSAKASASDHDDSEDSSENGEEADLGDGNQGYTHQDRPSQAFTSPEPTSPVAQQPHMLVSSSPSTSLQPENSEARCQGEVGDDVNPFTLNTPETRVGRKRKARNLGPILEVCHCGERISEFDEGSSDAVIACKRTGCETRFVSVRLMQKKLKMANIQSVASITFIVSALTIM